RPTPRRARRRRGRARAPSRVADGHDLVALGARWGLHLGDVARGLADQRPGDRRADRDEPLLQVGLVVADDLVGDLGAGFLFLESLGTAAGERNRGHLGNLWNKNKAAAEASGGGAGRGQSSAVRRAIPAKTLRPGRRGASCLPPPPRSRPCWCSRSPAAPAP